jgi:hypothetical protein
MNGQGDETKQLVAATLPDAWQTCMAVVMNAVHAGREVQKATTCECIIEVLSVFPLSRS